MKHILGCFLAMAAITFFGCSKSEQTNAPAPAQPAATTNQPQSTGQALEQYGHTMALAKKNALTKTDLISVDRAIQSYQADRGKNPESLDELITEKFLAKLPELPKGKAYSYNPQTAEVKIVDAP